MKYIISTDSSCDLPVNILTENNVHLFELQLEKEGVSFSDDLGSINYNHKSLYDDLRKGDMVRTSLTNMSVFSDKFTACAKDDLPIIYMGISSGGSGTYQSACLAKAEVLEKYPNAKIYIVDTFGGSGGVGYLVLKSIRLKLSGSSFEELIDWAEQSKNSVMHTLTVSNLLHLSRGGRLPKKHAVIGTLLNLKPILYITNEGTLELLSKERGRKKSLNKLISFYETYCDDKTEPIILTHTDCKEEAEAFANRLRNECGAEEVIVSMGHASMGVHTGPDTIGLYFKARQKEPLT